VVDWLKFAEVLDELAQRPSDAKLVGALRRHWGNGLASSLCSIASLQAKARSKLGEGVWWVTPRALQQATAWQVAQQKAKWFADRPVDDLCCGLGGDAVRLAERGSARAIDLNGDLLEMARANLAYRGFSIDQARTVCADVRSVRPTGGSLMHLDPDRRVGDKRRTQPDDYEPPWVDVLELLDRYAGGIVKLAPLAQLDQVFASQVHRIWISLQGSVREQSVLFGETIQHAGEQLSRDHGADRARLRRAAEKNLPTLFPTSPGYSCCAGPGERILESAGRLTWPPGGLLPGMRSAISLGHDGGATVFVEPAAAGWTVSVDQPQEYLIDPDPAIRAAGLTESFAGIHGLATLGGPSGFLTGDELPRESASREMAVVGRVIWSGACDDRKLRRELRSRNLFPQTIKVRGTDHDPEHWCKRYRSCGDQPVTLWIGRTSARRFAALTDAVIVDKASNSMVNP